MNILNMNVNHNQFGIGEVIEQTEKTIRVKFSDRTSLFQYPESFPTYLSVNVPEIQSQLEFETREKNRQRQLMFEHRCREFDVMKIVDKRNVYVISYENPKLLSNDKITVSDKNVDVFNNIKSVEENDVIINVVNSEIKSVSVVNSKCLTSTQSDSKFRVVNCKSTPLPVSIKLTDLISDIEKYSYNYHLPFNLTENTYLCHLDEKLSKIVIDYLISDKNTVPINEKIDKFLENPKSPRKKYQK